MAKNEKKQFDLKDSEIQMLNAMNQSAQNAMANFLSFLCIERLAVPVTENTKFEVKDRTLTVWEEKPKKDTEKTGDKPDGVKAA